MARWELKEAPGDLIPFCFSALSSSVGFNQSLPALGSQDCCLRPVGPYAVLYASNRRGQGKGGVRGSGRREAVGAERREGGREGEGEGDKFSEHSKILPKWTDQDLEEECRAGNQNFP